MHHRRESFVSERNNRDLVIIILVLAAGISLRVASSMRGHNWDVESYGIVANLVNQGKNVYANTSRYNYGPVWLLILGFLYRVGAIIFPGASTVILLRYFVMILLTMADIGIMLILWKSFGIFSSILFFLNPISIIITGYHSQFDNLAILFALIAAYYFERAHGASKGKEQMIGLVLLGFSLCIKHVAFAFPFWLAVKQNSWRRRALVLLLPVVIFLTGFIPFAFQGYRGIITNVFQYRSGNNAPFFYFVVPRMINTHVSSYMIFYTSMLALGVIFIRKSPVQSLLYYLGALVIFSPSVVNQYFAIPIALVSVFPNFYYLSYTALGTLDLVVTNKDGLYFRQLIGYIPQKMRLEISGYRGSVDWLISLLFIGYIWMIFGVQIKAKIWHYLQILLNPKKHKTV